MIGKVILAAIAGALLIIPIHYIIQFLTLILSGLEVRLIVTIAFILGTCFGVICMAGVVGAYKLVFGNLD